VCATPTGDGDDGDGVGLELARVEEVQALVNSPTTTTKVVAVRRSWRAERQQ
jgi:hypothetical protein